MMSQWVLENLKPYIVKTEGANAILFWAQFLETDIQETLVQC